MWQSEHLTALIVEFLVQYLIKDINRFKNYKSKANEQEDFIN